MMRAGAKTGKEIDTNKSNSEGANVSLSSFWTPLVHSFFLICFGDFIFYLDHGQQKVRFFNSRRIGEHFFLNIPLSITRSAIFLTGKSIIDFQMSFREGGLEYMLIMYQLNIIL